MRDQASYMMKVALPSVPVDDYGISTFVALKAYMERLVDVSDEMGKEHEALCQVICSDSNFYQQIWFTTESKLIGTILILLLVFDGSL